MTAQRGIGEARRQWLLRTATLLGAAAVPLAVRQALAAGEQLPTQGFYRVEGEVRVNGRAAAQGGLVRPGATIETGANGQAVFVVGRDAFLLRGASRVETGGQRYIDTLRLVTGKLLSVFDRGVRRIETQTVLVGIRGTGIYVEAEPGRSYVCTCYGVAALQSRDQPRVTETVSTRHHEQPRYIHAGRTMPAIEMIGPAPVINHTDAELVMLEALVGRKPPFFASGGPPY
jgi:hypothetical protein